ncbi:MAG: hypothetical protein JWN70_434 [Planctomycetaceae bacterium]|nr:hypothetical protein [Planctomycetaceae bacterium]
MLASMIQTLLLMAMPLWGVARAYDVIVAAPFERSHRAAVKSPQSLASTQSGISPTRHQSTIHHFRAIPRTMIAHRPTNSDGTQFRSQYTLSRSPANRSTMTVDLTSMDNHFTELSGLHR